MGSEGDALGASVGLDGDTIVAGAQADAIGNNVFTQGALYTFARTGAADPPESAKLTATGRRGGRSSAVSPSLSMATRSWRAPTATRRREQPAGFRVHLRYDGCCGRFETAKLTASDGQPATSGRVRGRFRTDDHCGCRRPIVQDRSTVLSHGPRGPDGDPQVHCERRRESGPTRYVSGDQRGHHSRRCSPRRHRRERRPRISLGILRSPSPSRPRRRARSSKRCLVGRRLTTDHDGRVRLPRFRCRPRSWCRKVTSGTIAVHPEPAGAPPSGFTFFDHQVDLSGPAASSAADPYVVTFGLDASLIGFDAAWRPASVPQWFAGPGLHACLECCSRSMCRGVEGR